VAAVSGRRLAVALGVLALGVGVASQVLPAGASDVSEGNDTKGALDVRRVDKLLGRRPVWRVTTWSGWRAREMRDRGYVLVHIDTFGSARSDYYILIRSGGERLRGLLFTNRLPPANDRRLGFVRVWRRDRRSVSARLPLRRLRIGEEREMYRWYVQTVFTSWKCRRTCLDRAPDSGAVEQTLERAQPSPSPTDDD
jgi:hypothetical protein